MDSRLIREIAEKLTEAVPEGARDLKADLERNFEAVLAGVFERLDLVTREEFDVQRKVLERTREKLAELEAEVKRLESESAGSDD